MSGKNFQISIRAVCPACSEKCPNLTIRDTCLYGDNAVVYREFYCVNEGTCFENYERIKESMENSEKSLTADER